MRKIHEKNTEREGEMKRVRIERKRERGNERQIGERKERETKEKKD